MPQDSTLAGLGVWATSSKGRVHSEPPDALRDPFEVDRHRVLGSAAFRRLQYKTQVFVNVEHDHFRTRLTHTLEVAEIARRLAVALGVNERLAEVIALAHDLGHPPFGHAGEAALRGLMSAQGGFEHNIQSLRVVDFLEHPFPQFRGLNLTFEVREGLAKHATLYDAPDAGTAGGLDVGDLFATGAHPTLEAQIASAADRIAYDCHDLEDAIGAGLVDEAELNNTTLWRDAADPVRARHADARLAAVRRPILNRIVDRLIGDVVAETRLNVAGAGVRDVAAVRQASADVVAFSEGVETLCQQLEQLLVERVYRHERVRRADSAAAAAIEKLFAYFRADPARLPPRFADRVTDQGVHRVVCDYIAGMTDRFCQAEHDRMGAG